MLGRITFNFRSKFGAFKKLGVLLIAFLLTTSLIRTIITISSADKKIEEVKKRVERLKQENETLKKEVDKTTTSEFLEKAARDKLGLAKPGEAVIVLPDEETLKKMAPKIDREEEIALPLPNWQKWLNLFL